jgi:hydrogenase large subunit
MTELIEKIEGEAKLHFNFDKDKKIDLVEIEFLSSRYIENILKNKAAQDALVINPRVCGICGHAHLIATVQALEDCYKNIEVSPKAQIIRELTLNFELIQNHFKWFYMVISPLLGKKQDVLKAVHPSQLMGKGIATLAGQYPHTSYAIVGGIVNEVLNNDLIKVQNYIDETLEFYRQHIINVDLEGFIACENIDNILKQKGDLPDIMQTMEKRNLTKTGQSYDRFIVFGQNSYFKKGRAVKTRVNHNINSKYIYETHNEDSYAKNVKFKKDYYEVGPLSRAMINKTSLIKDSHRRYKDSMYSRILARVCEIPQLLIHSKELLKKLDLSQPSYIKPSIDITNISGTGTGCVEAARGSLVHKVQLEKGKIEDYQIITPTQWNLGNGTKEQPGISQKAMNGLSEISTAQSVFKSFDVCSVCTTH